LITMTRTFMVHLEILHDLNSCRADLTASAVYRTRSHEEAKQGQEIVESRSASLIFLPRFGRTHTAQSV
jgi:hypothetical protein